MAWHQICTGPSATIAFQTQVFDKRTATLWTTHHWRTTNTYTNKLCINSRTEGRVMQICVSELSHHWTRLWLVACLASSHYLNPMFLILPWGTYFNAISFEIHSRKCIWICRLQNGVHLVSTPMSFNDLFNVNWNVLIKAVVERHFSEHCITHITTFLTAMRLNETLHGRYTFESRLIEAL